MIFKQSIRGFTSELAKHLTKLDENEKVRFVKASKHFQSFEGMGFTPEQELKLYLAQYDLMAAEHKKNHKHVNHVSCNPHPDYELDEIQWQRVWEVYEQEYDLPKYENFDGEDEAIFQEIEHTKEGRKHRHRPYYALDEQGRYMRINHNYVRNEKIARMLEYEFGHKLTKGRHNRAVHSWLMKGNEFEREVAQAMEEAGLMYEDRPVAEHTLQDKQITERTGLDRKTVKEFVLAAYETSDNGRAFENALAQHNIFLAQGDTGSKRSDAGKFIIVDDAGTPVGLSKCGVKVKEFKEKFPDIKPEYLPTVKSVKAHIKEQQKDNDTDRGEQGGDTDIRRNYKGEYQALRELQDTEWQDIKEAAERYKIIDEGKWRETQDNWKRFNAEKAPLLEKIDRKYQKRKEKAKKKFKPRWRKLFRKHNADLQRATLGNMNISQKLILMFRYRKEIRQQYGRKAFGKYFRFWLNRQRQMEVVIDRHRADKEALMKTYIKVLEKERELVMKKTTVGRKFEALRQHYKGLSEINDKMQKILREARKQAYAQQKIRDKKRRDALSLSIKTDIVKRTGKPPKAILPSHDIQFNKGNDRGRDDDYDR